MQFAEHIEKVAAQNVSGTGQRQPASGTPLQIRMNPFMAAAKRSAFFDARIYLVERACSIGQPDLFTQEALNLVIDGSGGLQRDLRAIAQFAFFAAASEGASRIESRHAVIAMESWAAQNGNALAQRPRTAETGLRVFPAADANPVTPALPQAPLQPPAAPETAPRQALVVLGNKSVIAAAPAPHAPAADAEPVTAEMASISYNADAEAGSVVTSPSLIRRQVLSFIEAEARAVPAKIQVAKRRWLRRSVEMTAAFLALFAFFGMVSTYVATRNAPPAKPAFAVQVQQADLTAAVVEAPAPAASKPQTQAYVIPEPVKETLETPPAAAPVVEPVENTSAENLTPEELQEQVPMEDYVKSETP